jgi:predicted RNase H-like HicB family nuclease
MSERDEHDHYSMVLEWDPEDRIYVVTVPELPGCRTHGKTYEEAVRQGQDAIATWLDTARAWDDPIPPPRVFAMSEH